MVRAMTCIALAAGAAAAPSPRPCDILGAAVRAAGRRARAPLATPHWRRRPAPPLTLTHPSLPPRPPASQGNPCVAAHSTVRALYAAYAGALYNVTRASDNATFSVPVLAPGGYADKAAHDAFCPALDCVISHVLDQSPMCVT